MCVRGKESCYLVACAQMRALRNDRPTVSSGSADADEGERVRPRANRPEGESGQTTLTSRPFSSAAAAAASCLPSLLAKNPNLRTANSPASRSPKPVAEVTRSLSLSCSRSCTAARLARLPGCWLPAPPASRPLIK